MADTKHETKTEEKAHAKAAAAEDTEQLFACHDVSKPDEPCVCLFATEEDAKKKFPGAKVVDVDPAIWKPKKKTKFAATDPEYACLAWAIDNRGK